MWHVIGQERAVALLHRSWQGGRLAHAYLIVGPPRVGKGTLALDLARLVNCLQAQEAPCGQCPNCLRISQGLHPDVQIVMRQVTRAEIGTDHIKEVIASAYLPPFEGRHKVFIIDGAEQLSPDAANRLLKTLEEPPPRILFLLLTSQEGAVLPTLASRCQRIEVRPIPWEAMALALVQRWQFPQDKAQLLARLSRGRLGWALSPACQEHREYWLQRLEELLDQGVEGRFAVTSELAHHWEQHREEVTEALHLWEMWWRDLLLLQVGAEAGKINRERNGLTGHAHRWPLPQIRAALHHLAAVKEQLGQNANPRLALEVLMLNLPK